jgi:hypothetical protein
LEFHAVPTKTLKERAMNTKMETFTDQILLWVDHYLSSRTVGIEVNNSMHERVPSIRADHSTGNFKPPD